MRPVVSVLVALAVMAPGLALAQTAEEEEGARPGPFLAASMGGGAMGDASPGLTGSSPGLRGHLEVGYGDGRFWSGALSVALGRSYYDNTIEPPEDVQPEDSIRLTRVGFGAVGEGRLPLGRVVPLLGAGVYLDRMSAAARGSLIGIQGDYFEADDLAVGLEARVGVDVRVHAAVEVGARAGWHWSRADLAELTGGAAWLSGPWVELRVTFDASGFRMATGSARSR
jgi:hypothetical protein